jgi:hypothetical protein
MVAQFLAEVGPCDDNAQLFVNGNEVVSVSFNEVTRFLRDLPDGDYNFRFRVINSTGWAWRATVRMLINGYTFAAADETGGSGFYTGTVYDHEWQARIADGQVSEFGIPGRAVAVPSMAGADGNFETVVQALREYYPGAVGEDFTTRVAAANSAAALATIFGQGDHSSPLSPNGQKEASPGVEPAAAPGGTTVRVFWWGFHVQISHEDLMTILNSADLINALVVAIGGSIPSPAAPWIKLIGPFVVLIHDKLRQMDKGYGIYISMSWFAPGAFVPTPVQGPEQAPMAAPKTAEQHTAERATGIPLKAPR